MKIQKEIQDKENEIIRNREDRNPIEIEKRLMVAKAELELLKPYLKTLRRKKTWDEMQKDLRRQKSA